MNEVPPLSPFFILTILLIPWPGPGTLAVARGQAGRPSSLLPVFCPTASRLRGRSPLAVLPPSFILAILLIPSNVFSLLPPASWRPLRLACPRPPTHHCVPLTDYSANEKPAPTSARGERILFSHHPAPPPRKSAIRNPQSPIAIRQSPNPNHSPVYCLLPTVYFLPPPLELFRKSRKPHLSRSFAESCIHSQTTEKARKSSNFSRPPFLYMGPIRLSPQTPHFRPDSTMSSPLPPPNRLKYRSSLGIAFPPFRQSSQNRPPTCAHAPFPPIFASKRPKTASKCHLSTPHISPAPSFPSLSSAKPQTRHPTPDRPPCLLSPVYLLSLLSPPCLPPPPNPEPQTPNPTNPLSTSLPSPSRPLVDDTPFSPLLFTKCMWFFHKPTAKRLA